MKFELPDLPYERTALAPHISEETLNYHYGKHHQAYLNKLEAAINDTPEAEKSLTQIVKDSKDNPGVYNNAAQVWNHTFYWRCMTPNGGGEVPSAVKEKIDDAFGSFDNFKTEFEKAAATQFGSGWAWLVKDNNGKLSIEKTPNAKNPISEGLHPLLTVDVWEHAYYLDYQNDRPGYISTFFDKLIDWSFVEKNMNASAEEIEKAGE